MDTALCKIITEKSAEFIKMVLYKDFFKENFKVNVKDYLKLILLITDINNFKKNNFKIETFNILDLINSPILFSFQENYKIDSLDDKVLESFYLKYPFRSREYHKKSIMYHMNQIKNNEAINPIILIKINEYVFLCDGSHRVYAHILEKKWDIPAYIIYL